MLDQANKDIGPRNRAPLGNKTTNVKATAFQTPAPPTQEKQSAKPTSPRFQRARVKVQEAEAEVAEDGREEWEIEYMPPREVPLPDYRMTGRTTERIRSSKARTSRAAGGLSSVHRKMMTTMSSVISMRN